MSNRRPPPGSMVWWRFTGAKEYRFGYCTYVKGCNIVRMGTYNGDNSGGSVVDVYDIDWIAR